MNLFPILLPFILYLVLPRMLFAEEKSLFQKNKMYFEFGGGSPELDLGGGDANTLFYLTSLSSSQSRIDSNLTRLALAQGSQNLNPTARTYRVVVEYALAKWIGIGGSINSTAFHLSGFTHGQGNLSGNVTTPFIFSSANSDIINGLAIYSLTPDEKGKKQSLNSADFEIGFHGPLPGQSFDPYLKLVLGSGKIDPSGAFEKWGAILGIRYEVIPRLNFSLEYYASKYQINSRYFPSSSYSGGGRIVEESGVRILMGTSMESP